MCCAINKACYGNFTVNKKFYLKEPGHTGAAWIKPEFWKPLALLAQVVKAGICSQSVW